MIAQRRQPVTGCRPSAGDMNIVFFTENSRQEQLLR